MNRFEYAKTKSFGFNVTEGLDGNGESPYDQKPIWNDGGGCIEIWFLALEITLIAISVLMALGSASVIQYLH